MVASRVAKTSPTKAAAARERWLLWFDELKTITPDHVVTSRIAEVQEVHQHQKQLEGRSNSILVKKAEVELSWRRSCVGTSPVSIQYIESTPPRTCSVFFFQILRGSNLNHSYRGTARRIPLPDGWPTGIREAPYLALHASTKAEQGAHDEDVFSERYTHSNQLFPSQFVTKPAQLARSSDKNDTTGSSFPPSPWSVHNRGGACGT